MHFRQFHTLFGGIDHSGSRPFNYTLTILSDVSSWSISVANTHTVGSRNTNVSFELSIQNHNLHESHKSDFPMHDFFQNVYKSIEITMFN